VLYWAAGLQPDQRKRDKPFHRTHASGGARFPLEIYPLVLRGPIPKGLYHYNIKDNVLEQLWQKDFLPEIDRYLIDPVQWKNAAIVFFITCVFERNQIKYSERGYRYVFIDAGHLGQNFYLAAEALGLKCCAVGGFVDQEVNQLIDIDGIHEAAIYSILVGK